MPSRREGGRSGHHQVRRGLAGGVDNDSRSRTAVRFLTGLGDRTGCLHTEPAGRMAASLTSVAVARDRQGAAGDGRRARRRSRLGPRGHPRAGHRAATLRPGPPQVRGRLLVFIVYGDGGTRRPLCLWLPCVQRCCRKLLVSSSTAVVGTSKGDGLTGPTPMLQIAHAAQPGTASPPGGL